MVTLHRIGPTAGPVDSARTDAAGRYAFAVSRPDTAAMYLATSRYGGIAYFAKPARVGDPAEVAEIHVFDTTSAPLPLRHLGRHVVVSAPDAEGRREVVEVWELGNDGTQTRLSVPGNPAFVTSVPAAATGVRSTQGDFAGAGAEIAGREVRVVAPVAPGVRQLVVTYDLAPEAFPLALVVAESTAVVEVLLEEAGAAVDSPMVEAVGAVPSDGRNFLRYLGDDAAPGVLTIRVPETAASAGTWPWLLGLGVASLAAMGWTLRPARRAPAPPRSTVLAGREAMQATHTALTLQLSDPALDPGERARVEEHRRAIQQSLDDMAGGPRLD
jgi:hypothetical protein